jgi:hypothetical protein
MLSERPPIGPFHLVGNGEESAEFAGDERRRAFELTVQDLTAGAGERETDEQCSMENVRSTSARSDRDFDGPRQRFPKIPDLVDSARVDHEFETTPGQDPHEATGRPIVHATIVGQAPAQFEVDPDERLAQIGGLERQDDLASRPAQQIEREDTPVPHPDFEHRPLPGRQLDIEEKAKATRFGTGRSQGREMHTARVDGPAQLESLLEPQPSEVEFDRFPFGLRPQSGLCL